MATSTGNSEERLFVNEVGVAAEVASLVEPLLEDAGCRLVRVSVSGRDGGTIQVMADRKDGSFTIEDCKKISQSLSPLLDAHDPMPGSYNLEVSSPGIDRPLVRPSDFKDWIGYEAKIELKELVDGRKRFRGLIEGYSKGEVRLEVKLDNFENPQFIGLPADLIESAKLVLSDELMKAALTKQKED